MFNELEAANRVIRVLGDSKSLSIDESEEIEIAFDILIEKKNMVLSKGWFFNINYELEILVDVDGFIQLPTETLKIDDIIDNLGEPIQSVIRGSRLYNLTDNTFVFEEKVVLDLTINMDFDDLIIQAKEYITCLAKEEYSNNMDGSSTLYQLNEKSLIKAEYNLEQLNVDSLNLVHYGNSNIYSTRNNGVY